MALRDWIIDSGQIASAIPARVASPDTQEARKIAELATLALATEEKEEIPATAETKPEPAAELPSWCRATCKRLDILQGCSPGCVRSLANGPWRHEWLSLAHIGSCPESKN